MTQTSSGRRGFTETLSFLFLFLRWPFSMKAFYKEKPKSVRDYGINDQGHVKHLTLKDRKGTFGGLFSVTCE